MSAAGKQCEIGICDACGDKVPMPFLKVVDLPQAAVGLAICHPCYSAGAKNRGKRDDFFAGKTKREIQRLRGTVPKFPETLPDPTKTHKTVWADEFTRGCDRKAKWYGFRDVMEFFEQCLK